MYLCFCKGDDEEDEEAEEFTYRFADISSPLAIFRISASTNLDVLEDSPSVVFMYPLGQQCLTRSIDSVRKDANFFNFSFVGHFNSATRYLKHKFCFFYFSKN